ncbi:MAG: ACT domain-containing protein [Lachnospiraceae bacterium]|nr:ACT domain-containing protein [Lachnospiraceae bacterium]
MKRTVITVVGKDSVGIIAKTCTYLAENEINILDISQTIVGGFFNMMMIVDVAGCQKEFGTMADELERLGVDMGCIVKAQREDIFDNMHRI